jgi:hypothetical protein
VACAKFVIEGRRWHGVAKAAWGIDETAAQVRQDFEKHETRVA